MQPDALEAAHFRSGSEYRNIRQSLGSKAFPPSRQPHALENLKGPPGAYANVLIHNFLLHGAHPGASSAEIVQNLTPVLRAGVTTFVCMQQEVPSVATKEAVSTRSNFGGSNVVTGKNYMGIAQAIVDAGGFPTSGTSLSFVHAPVPAHGGGAAHGHAYTAGGIIEDDKMKALALDLLAHMKAGEYLYLHCSDGNGRSGVTAAILTGLAYGIGPVEALSLTQKSRNDRPGAQGASPETHEQRMQVHRILSDQAFRQAAAAVKARPSDTAGRESAAQLDGTLKKIRGIAARKGLASLIHLKRYAARLAGAGHTVLGNIVGGELTKQGFDKLCQDAEWYLTPDESVALWTAAVQASKGQASPGCISVPTVFRIVRGPLNAVRAPAVHDAFRRLSAGMASVRLDSLAGLFVAAGHPDVKANKRRVEEVTSEFLETFGVQARTERVGGGAGGGGGVGARVVGAEEFEDYYADISAAVTEDTYFEIIMYGCWPSGPGGSVNDAGQGQGMDSGGRTARQQRMNKLDPHLTAPIGRAPPPGTAGAPGSGIRSIFSDPGISSLLPKATDSGFVYNDIREMEVAVAALRIHLSKVSEFAVAHLAATLRRADVDRDGYVDAYDFRAALRDTVTACAPASISSQNGHVGSASGGTSRAAQIAALRAASSAGSGLPGSGPGATAGPAAFDAHPMVISDADANAVFEAVAAKLTPSTLNSSRPLIPLEAMHAALRGHLPEARRQTVQSIFNSLDKEGAGAVPVSEVMLAFKAEDHPAVTSGKVSVPALYRIFQDSFGEGFSLVDKHGASLRLVPGAAGEAYYGHGDSKVRLSFWEAWHEALSAAFTDDAAFNLVAFHVWAGGNAAHRRAGRGQATSVLPGAAAGQGGPGHGPTSATVAARFDPRSMAAKAEDGEEGLLSSMSRLNVHRNTGLPGTTSSPRRMGALSRMEHEGQTQSYARPGTAGTNPAQGYFSSQHGAVQPQDNPIERAKNAPFLNRTPGTSNNVGQVVDAEYEQALQAARSMLLRGGPKRAHQLVRSFEDATISVAQHQAPAYGGYGSAPSDGSLSRPIPVHAFTAVLRDNSLGMSQRQLEVIVARLDPSRSGYVTTQEFLSHLHGALPGSRASIIQQAYDHVARKASEAQGMPLPPHALPPPPPLDEVRMLYRSAAHPDVKSGKRGEEEVLRDFLSTFDGHTFCAGPNGTLQGEGGSKLVTLAGFSEYFAMLSMLLPHDAIFATILHDVWGLYEARAPAHAAESRPAGGAGYGSGTVASVLFGQDTQPGYSKPGVVGGLDASAGGQFTGGRGPGQRPLPAEAYTAGGYGVQGKVDLTTSRRGWGVERGRY